MSSWLSMAPGANPMTMMRAGDSEVATAVNYVHELIRREIARGNTNSNPAPAPHPHPCA